MHFVNLMFRMPVNMHLQNYNRYKFWKAIYTSTVHAVTMRFWNLDRKHLQ